MKSQKCFRAFEVDFSSLKKFFYYLGLIFLLSFIHQLGKAQICNFPLPPSNTCDDAPLLCDLNGYCSNNAGATNTGTPNAFCGVVENNSWVKFIAGSEEFVLEVSVSNCNQGTGVQVQIFSTEDCNFFTAVSNCIDGATATGTINATDLMIGNSYYLMVDGKGGDVCDFSFSVLSGEILSPAYSEIEAEGALCENETLILNANATSPNSNLSFQWRSDDGNILTDTSIEFIEINAPGTYWVIVEDLNACKDSSSIIIPLNPNPEVTIVEPDTIDCLLNTSVQLQASSNISSSAFEWFTNEGNILSGAETATPIVDREGSYQVLVIDTLSSCNTNSQILVFQDTETPVAISSVTGELNCLNTTLTLDGTESSFGDPFTLNWSTATGNIISGENTLQPVVNLPGTYFLEITNTENGCIDSSFVVVTLNDAEPSGAKIRLRNPCFGEQSGSIIIDSVIGGTLPYQYSFDSLSFQASNLKDFLTPNEYIVTIKDATGCEWDTTVALVEQPLLVLDFGQDNLTTALGCEVNLELQTNVLVSNIDSIIWLPNDPDCNNCLERIINPLETVIYQVKLTDTNGCTATDQIQVFVNKERNIYIPNVFSPNSDGINDIFYIHGGKDVSMVKTFKIFDRWGGQIFEEENFLSNDINYGWDGRLNGKRVSNSVFIYFAEIEFIDGITQIFQGSFSVLK